MTTPGFTAELALDRRFGKYRGNYRGNEAGPNLSKPAMVSPASEDCHTRCIRVCEGNWVCEWLCGTQCSGGHTEM